MWENFLFTVNTVFPLLLMMLVGYAARRGKIIGDNGVRQANSCVFYVFLPLMLCFNIMDTPHNASIDLRTLLYGAAMALLFFGALFLLVPRFCKPVRTRGVMIQAIGRSSYALFGIPLVQSMFPNADMSIPSLMVIAVVPIFNVCSTVALMMYSDECERPNVRKIVRGVLLNPIILGTLLGFLLWELRVTAPTIIAAPLRKLAGVATPLALFLLGASINFDKIRADAKLLTVGVVGRLIVIPGIALPIAVALGIRGVSLAALVAAFASPATVSGYAMAQQMGGDAEFAAAHIALTTALCIVTVFGWVFALKTLGYLG